MPFKDQNVVITGGTSGIGLELARQLAAMGSNLFILARSADKLEEVRAELELDFPGISQVYPVDVVHAEQVANVIAQIIENSGVPDVLINSAGVAHPGYVQDLDLDIFHWMMDVNYFGTVNVIKAVLPGMMERGSGYIVNIASMSAAIGLLG